MDYNGHGTSKTFNIGIIMKYNDSILAEYGAFMEDLGNPPQQGKVLPNEADYTQGSFIRSFVKKINENIFYEINPAESSGINENLYKIIRMNWVISGLRETRKVKGITDYGVSDLNKFEIERVKIEEEVDLSSILQNPLEYWRGH